MPHDPAGEATVEVLELEWWMPLDHVPSDPAPIHGVLERLAPGVLPERYGPGDPPRWRIRDGDRRGFEAWWREMDPRSGGAILAWQCAVVPSHGVLIAAAPPFDPGSIPAGRLKMTVPADTLSAPVAADLLATVAGMLGSIHGSASRLSGWTSWRGGLVPGSGSESAGQPLGTEWIGLSPTIPSLAWIGPAYEESLAGWLAAVPTAPSGDAIVAGPVDRLLTQAEARDQLPPLPADLVARRRADLPPAAPPSLAAVRIPASLRRAV
jgi:hypothetical protein